MQVVRTGGAQFEIEQSGSGPDLLLLHSLLTDPGSFSAIEARLICRRASGSSEELDLSEAAHVWREAVRQAVGDKAGGFSMSRGRRTVLQRATPAP